MVIADCILVVACKQYSNIGACRHIWMIPMIVLFTIYIGIRIQPLNNQKSPYPLWLLYLLSNLPGFAVLVVLRPYSTTRCPWWWWPRSSWSWWWSPEWLGPPRASSWRLEKVPSLHSHYCSINRQIQIRQGPSQNSWKMTWSHCQKIRLCCQSELWRMQMRMPRLREASK